MIKRLFLLVFLIAGLIAGATVYLQPDDIKDCGEIPNNAKNCNEVDAIVAISGGDTFARTKEAIKLFNNGWAKVLIFSGAAQDKSGPSNASEMKRLAIEMGVKEDAIIIEETAETTRQNAEKLQPILKEKNFKTIILVTSGYHQRRAGLEFEKYTDDVKILNHPVKEDKDWSVWWWITPRGWRLAVSEIAKIIVFSLVGA